MYKFRKISLLFIFLIQSFYILSINWSYILPGAITTLPFITTLVDYYKIKKSFDHSNFPPKIQEGFAKEEKELEEFLHKELKLNNIKNPGKIKVKY